MTSEEGVFKSLDFLLSLKLLSLVRSCFVQLPLNVPEHYGSLLHIHISEQHRVPYKELSEHNKHAHSRYLLRKPKGHSQSSRLRVNECHQNCRSNQHRHGGPQTKVIVEAWGWKSQKNWKWKGYRHTCKFVDFRQLKCFESAGYHWEIKRANTKQCPWKCSDTGSSEMGKLPVRICVSRCKVLIHRYTTPKSKQRK